MKPALRYALSTAKHPRRWYLAYLLERLAIRLAKLADLWMAKFCGCQVCEMQQRGETVAEHVRSVLLAGVEKARQERLKGLN